MKCDSTPTPSSQSSWRLAWRVFSLVKPCWRMALGLMIVIVAASGLDIAVPFLTKNLIDGIMRSLTLRATMSFETLGVAAFSIFLATVTTRLLRSFYHYQLTKMASRAEDSVKSAAYANFLRLDTEYQTRVNTGEIVGALDRGSSAIYVILNEIAGQNFFPPLLIAAGVLVSLVAKNIWIALLVCVPLPAYLLAVSRMRKRMDTIETELSEAFERVSKEAYDIASNVRLVKRFGREGDEAGFYRKLQSAARSTHHRAERLWATAETMQSFIATVGRVGVIVLGGYLTLTRRCTVGDYVLFIGLQDMIYTPISQLSVILPKLRRNISRAGRLFEVLDEQPKLRDRTGAVPLRAVTPSIEFRNVDFHYPNSERLALQNVNLRVPAGSTVALIGASGSGKSTLVSLLQRLYDPQAGSILVDGRDLREFTQESLRKQIAVVPQEIELLSRSIEANIGYSRGGVCASEIEVAARMAQAHEFIQRCPAGYRSLVGGAGREAFGGERQRLGIARALVQDPTILVFDEATSHLDNESERLIQAAMDEITRGRTCFIVAHRLSTVRNADLVVVFRQGGIEAVGTHEQLWSTSPTYARLHGIHLTERPAGRPVAVEHLEEFALAS